MKVLWRQIKKWKAPRKSAGLGLKHVQPEVQLQFAKDFRSFSEKNLLFGPTLWSIWSFCPLVCAFNRLLCSSEAGRDVSPLATSVRASPLKLQPSGHLLSVPVAGGSSLLLTWSLSRWWPEQLVFSLSSGTVSSFFPFLSLLSLDDGDFVVKSVSRLAILCSPSISASDKAPCVSWQSRAHDGPTQSVIPPPPSRLERTSRTPLEFFIRLTRIFQPVFHLPDSAASSSLSSSLTPRRLCDWAAPPDRLPPQWLI